MLKPLYLKTNGLYNKIEDLGSPLEIFTRIDLSFSSVIKQKQQLHIQMEMKIGIKK